MARKARKLLLKYPPIPKPHDPLRIKHKPGQQPPNIVGIEDFPDVSQITPQLDMDPGPKHLVARTKPDREPEPDKLGSPSTYDPIRPKSKEAEREKKDNKQQIEEQLKKDKDIREAAIQTQRLSTLSRQLPPPLHPPQPRRPPPPKLPPPCSNRQLARQRPQPTKPYHHISPSFGTWWHAGLPRTTKDQPLGKSIAIQSPDWKSKVWIVPPPGTVIPKPNIRIYNKYSMEQVQQREQEERKLTNEQMLKLAVEESQREHEAKLAAEQAPPPKLTKSERRKLEFAEATKRYDERMKKEMLEKNFPPLGVVPEPEEKPTLEQ